MPAKEVLRNKAGVCPPLPALCEIIDNVFDNCLAAGTRELEIHIAATAAQIVITENSGGISREKLEPLVRLGVSRQDRRGSIGAWGEGFKVAAFALASEVEVHTHYPGQEPVAVHFPEHWLDSADWRVPVYSIDGDAPASGSTVFRFLRLKTTIDWAEVMRELPVIYGQKIVELKNEGVHVGIRLSINGAEFPMRPIALADPDVLAARMAFPPFFEPRRFHARIATDDGDVDLSVVVAMTARHSGETSGVYLYGNGRLFARALRSRAVGYGDSGNAILRDHPMCWRLHAYVFLRADNGANIPWQAPLKDGVSVNHPIMAPLRQILTRVFAPYSRVARVARASELLPYTIEWQTMSATEQAEILFGDAPDREERLRRLPRALRQFKPNPEIPTFELPSEEANILLENLESRAKALRELVSRREKDGDRIQEHVLRTLNPAPFRGEPATAASTLPPPAPAPAVRKVVVELRETQLRRLRERFGVDDNRAAVAAAAAEVLRTARKEAQRGRRRR